MPRKTYFSNNLAIRLTNISKRYTIHHEKPTLAEKIMRRDETFWALKDINLEITKGERVGIIGPNGSGKTTLLKIIAGITSPTSGSVEICGKIVSLIDLEAGFHPDLSGIQNIYLNAMLLGMKKNEITSTLKEIINFADIGQFIDVPFYTYSNGMKFRLAFSIAIASRADVLIMDEIFSSGDINFQNKTLKSIKKIQKNRKITTIACSNIPIYLWEFSNSFYSLSHGKLIRMGPKQVLQTIVTNNKKWFHSYSAYKCFNVKI